MTTIRICPKCGQETLVQGSGRESQCSTCDFKISLGFMARELLMPERWAIEAQQRKDQA